MHPVRTRRVFLGVIRLPPHEPTFRRSNIASTAKACFGRIEPGEFPAAFGWSNLSALIRFSGAEQCRRSILRTFVGRVIAGLCDAKQPSNLRSIRPRRPPACAASSRIWCLSVSLNRRRRPSRAGGAIAAGGREEGIARQRPSHRRRGRWAPNLAR
jgi:hypothetical protein